jgi:hypothetical protein
MPRRLLRRLLLIQLLWSCPTAAPSLERLQNATLKLRLPVSQPPRRPEQDAVDHGVEVMRASTVVLTTIFLGDKSSTLPYLRANLEVLGALFKKFSMVVATPASDKELRRLQQPGQQSNQSMAMEAYLHSWRTEAAQGVPPRPQMERTPYDLHVITNESRYGHDCVARHPRGHHQRICKIARARNAVMAAFEGTLFAHASFLIIVDSDMCHQWDWRVSILIFNTGGTVLQICALSTCCRHPVDLLPPPARSRRSPRRWPSTGSGLR